MSTPTRTWRTSAWSWPRCGHCLLVRYYNAMIVTITPWSRWAGASRERGPGRCWWRTSPTTRGTAALYYTILYYTVLYNTRYDVIDHVPGSGGEQLRMCLLTKTSLGRRQQTTKGKYLITPIIYWQATSGGGGRTSASRWDPSAGARAPRPCPWWWWPRASCSPSTRDTWPSPGVSTALTRDTCPDPVQ